MSDTANSMADVHHHPQAAGSAADPAPADSRPVLWTHYGLHPEWAAARLQPALRPLRGRLEPAAPPESLDPAALADGDWDILLVGPGAASDELPNVAAVVTQLSRLRPLDCLVVVEEADDTPLGHRVSLYRAGAAEILPLDATDHQLYESFRRLLGIALRRRAQIEQEKLRLVGQLAVSINHEINNPLTGLMGTAELLRLESEHLGEKQRRDIQTIIEQCHRIREVTARLRMLNHLRTIPYGSHDRMIDLLGEEEPARPPVAEHQPTDLFLPVPRLLVVDDNPLMIDLIGRMLERRCVVHAAGAGAEALERMRQHQYDVVLVDLILPEMDGLEIVRAARRLRPEQRIILMTAYQGDPRIDVARAEGVSGIIFKPFRLDEFEQILDEVLRSPD
ncbi:MAG: Chemotaxis protein CheY [candidate division BRC1 bacterium ADurb.BinA292]|nr:MAG: Chemotaxis protein CheY [candidate division BRC1 bacterium ADurb.BinA292]